MQASWTKRLFLAVVGVGLSGAAGSVALADGWPSHGHEPPLLIAPENCPAPTAPAAPTQAHPSDLPNGKAATPTPAPEQAQQAPEVLTPEATSDLGLGSVAGGSSLGMEGRSDANNRFNLFDNMAAIPQNRIWLGYQYQDGFRTGVVNGDLALAERRVESLYRVGVEVALGGNFSLAVQSEYISTAGSLDNADAWGNPQFMAKYAVINNECSVVSATLGFQPQVSTSAGEVHEVTTRFYPGFLFFQGVSDDLFLQGGAQFGISTSDLTNTFDAALSVGYWLYRDESLNVAGRTVNGDGHHCERRGIMGIIPQVEFLAANVIANDRTDPFNTVVAPGGAAVQFGEPRNVFNVTVGGRVIFTPRISMGAAYSIPIGGGFVNQNELMTSLNINF